MVEQKDRIGVSEEIRPSNPGGLELIAQVRRQKGYKK